MTGPWPTHASARRSCPRRRRWQRTPPVPRPLAGYSVNGVTFTDPASVPGSAADDPATVTTTGSPAPSPTTPNQIARAPGASLTPAIPPAGRPWGRTLTSVDTTGALTFKCPKIFTPPHSRMASLAIWLLLSV